jgi:hypothetical protein
LSFRELIDSHTTGNRTTPPNRDSQKHWGGGEMTMIPTGLEHWEVISLAAMSAITFLGFASTVGATLAYFIFREPAAVPSVSPAAAPLATATPALTRGPAVATFASARG